MGIVMVLGFFVGIILGSLSLALAKRSLQGKTFWGRSCCPHCKVSLRWYDLFPILSYFFLLGKCRYCKKNIGQEHIVVEIILGILIAFLFYQSFSNFSAIGGLELLFKVFFTTVLIILTITDLKKNLIPDRIIIPAIKISIIFVIFITIIKIIFLYYTLNQTLIGQYLLPPHSDYFERHALLTLEPMLGAIVTAAVLSLFFYFLIIITKGKGMGGGDVKLVALMGLGLGFPQAILATILGFFTGAIVALVMIIRGKKKFSQTLPFGPFLVTGSLITLFWGNQLLDWYLKLGT